jgi:hypothetical protein
MKLHQTKVSFSIRLAAFQASGGAYMKHCQSFFYDLTGRSRQAAALTPCMKLHQNGTLS